VVSGLDFCHNGGLGESSARGKEVFSVMAQSKALSTKEEQQLMADIWSPQIKDNPYHFVMYVFPWGKKGTPLENFKGPRTWQKNLLLEIAAHIEENKNKLRQNKFPEVFKDATASGRGPGKSTVVAWLNLWMMSCHLGASSITTANTEDQLKSRTWAELGRWHTLSINSHWFERNALSIKPASWFKDLIENQLKIDTGYYYAQAQLWSEERPDAFAGLHNNYGVLLIFDEASGIPQPIWSVSEGFFTEPTIYRFWLVFSNPRRNTGAFFECFHKNRDFWRKRTIDSRTVEGTDQKVFADIIARYGEDSDEARIEVKGQFPRQGDKQFISREVIENARTRELIADDWAPIIMGVDPARFGDDSTVIRFRQGRNARVIEPVVMKGMDNVRVADRCAELINKYNPDAVCIDSGAGAGVIDILKDLNFKVHEVVFGSSSADDSYGNKRTELWALTRDWLTGGCIDDFQELCDDLAGPEYRYKAKTEQVILEPKDEMKRRGLASPNHGDALALTFAVKVARRDRQVSRNANKGRMAADIDYDVFGS
jgi:hypothetical protein